MTELNMSAYPYRSFFEQPLADAMCCLGCGRPDGVIIRCQHDGCEDYLHRECATECHACRRRFCGAHVESWEGSHLWCEDCVLRISTMDAGVQGEEGTLP